MLKQVAMKVNQANMVKSLKFSFTNKTTTLGELMQNARRAGATKVSFHYNEDSKELVVNDDGTGISDMEALLTVAESGWDADTMALEHPFGIGFLSAIFACKHIEVSSVGGHFKAPTEDILAFKPITIKPIVWLGTTQIRLTGVDLTLSELQNHLTKLARGFPIPVELNGVSLDRPDALNSERTFIDTVIGQACLSGINNLTDNYSTYLAVYLQGLPVYNTSGYYLDSDRNAVHLDSAQFYARLPDRDKLIDEKDVIERVTSTLKFELRNKFIEAKKTLTPAEMVGFYRLLKSWDCLDLLNDVPVLPSRILSRIGYYPNCSADNHGDFYTLVPEILSKEEVETLGVVSFDVEMEDDGAALHMFAFNQDSLIYQYGLDAGHWLHDHIKFLKDPIVELINESATIWFNGDWVPSYVKFCDAYTIQVGDDVITISNDSMWAGGGLGVIVPKGDTSGEVVKQISSFTDNDDFQELACKSEVHDFSNFVVSNTSASPTDALLKLLPNFSGCPMLHGGTFTISVNYQGQAFQISQVA